MAQEQHRKTDHSFRCIDGGHTFDEARDPNGPLVLRQSAWCTTHDSPAVGIGDDVRAGSPRKPSRPA